MPEYIVECLIVEYLPCRRFYEEGAIVVLDFSMVTEQDLQQLPDELVILNGILLVHNIRNNVLKDRLLSGIGNLPMSRASLSDSTYSPEGQVSPSSQAMLYQSIDTEDWKLRLNVHKRVLVLDEDGIFQWTVTTNALISNDTAQQWFTSDLFSHEQLEALRRMHDTFYTDILRQAIPQEEAGLAPLRNRLRAFYEELESLRAGMRQTVLVYHQQAKLLPEARAHYTEEEPPLLTTFDEAAIREGAFKIRTHIE